MVLCGVREAVEEKIDREEEEAPSAIPAADTAAANLAVVVVAVLLGASLGFSFTDCRWMIEREDNNAGCHRSDDGVFPERISAPEECYM